METCKVKQLEKLWKAGKADTTCYCLRCLAEYHGIGQDETKKSYLADETEYRGKRTVTWEESGRRKKRKRTHRNA